MASLCRYNGGTGCESGESSVMVGLGGNSVWSVDH